MNIRILEDAERACAGISGFDGWMIGSVRIRSSVDRKPPDALLRETPGTSGSPAQDGSARLVRRGPSVSVVEAVAGSLSMRVLLVRPLKDPRQMPEHAVPDADPRRKPLRSFCISRGEMEQFLNRVGDPNPLHRGKEAILPGFLILNRLINALPGLSDAEADEGPDHREQSGGPSAFPAYEFRFLAPLHPGEEAEFSAVLGGFSLTARGRNILLIKEVSEQ